jgi:hypothetical protein
MEESGCGCLVVVSLGWLLGMMLAVTIAWEATHSVLYTSLYGLLGWFYVAYHFLA